MNRSILGVSMLLAAARAEEPVNKDGDGVSDPTSAVTPNTAAQAAPFTLEGHADGRVVTLPRILIPEADLPFSGLGVFATKTDGNAFFVQASLAAGFSIEGVISSAESAPATGTVAPEKAGRFSFHEVQALPLLIPTEKDRVVPSAAKQRRGTRSTGGPSVSAPCACAQGERWYDSAYEVRRSSCEQQRVQVSTRIQFVIPWNEMIRRNSSSYDELENRHRKTAHRGATDSMHTFVMPASSSAWLHHAAFAAVLAASAALPFPAAAASPEAPSPPPPFSVSIPDSSPGSQPASPGQGGDAGVPSVALFAGAHTHLRPSRIRPGDLFELTIEEEGLASATANLDSTAIPLFPAGPGRFRGFGAVPLDHPVGPAIVRVSLVGPEDCTRSVHVPFELVERAVAKTTLTVDSKFTRPSAAQQAQMRADAKAIADCYQVPFGPPLFTSNFIDPLAHRRGSRFGEKRIFNGSTLSQHWGLDIDGAGGEPVRAANDGTVVLARPCFMSGMTVLVSHGAGIFTGYFHFSKFAVSTGQAVKKGDILGYVGSTGRVTGPHLHFAARLHDVLIDPEALLDFDFTGASPAAFSGDPRSNQCP